ncbi:MAG: hypothetical protein FGM32_05015 [Candidatus Kapabacteria bacterium]|nr:hypothetical protein [Candidatus Kapabacteria bacterium]
MSAGTGITHSEFNGSGEDMLKFLQIWIIPERLGAEPRYGQATVGPIAPNTIRTVVGPKGTGTPLWINQQAWLSMGHATSKEKLIYNRRQDRNGVFIFAINGSITVGGNAESHYLAERDGLGIVDTSRLEITADADATFIVIDVPVG